MIFSGSELTDRNGMGWRAFLSAPGSTDRFQEQNHSDGHQQDRLILSERHNRQRRNAVTVFTMEDVLKSNNFQSFLNTHSARTRSRTSEE